MNNILLIVFFFVLAIVVLTIISYTLYTNNKLYYTPSCSIEEIEITLVELVNLNIVMENIRQVLDEINI